MSIPQFGRVLEEGVVEDQVEHNIPVFGRSLQESEPTKKSMLEKSVDKAMDLQRIPAQLSARGLESIISSPRETGEFLEKLVPKKTIIKGAEKIGLGKGAENFINFMEEHAPYKLFPSQEQTRSFTKQLFGDMYEPKNKWEERAGNAFGEFSSLVFPFLGKVPAPRAALTSSGANMIQALSDEMGLDPKWGNKLKAATYVLGSFIQPKAGEKFYRENYKLAEEALPKNATFSSKKLVSSLDFLEKEMSKGGISSADSPALKQIENIRKEVQGAQIPIESLMASKRKLNIERGNLYKQLEGNKPGIKMAKRNLDKVAHALDSTLDSYAKYDPNWGKFYKDANNAFAAVEGSKKAGKFINNNFSKLAISHLGLSSLLGHIAGLKTALGVTAAAYPGYKVTQTLTQIYKSKPLREEFFRLYKEAMAGNLKGVSRAVKKLDNGLDDTDQ